MYCQNCGEKIDDNAKFCPHCGAKVETNVKPSMNTNTQKAEEAVKDTSGKAGETLKKVSQTVTEGSKRLYSDVRSGEAGKGAADVKQNGIKGIANSFPLMSLILLICVALSLIGALLPYFKVSAFGMSETISLFKFSSISENLLGESSSTTGYAVVFILMAVVEALCVLFSYVKKRFENWAQFTILGVNAVALLVNLYINSKVKNVDEGYGFLTMAGGYYLSAVVQVVALIFIILYMCCNSHGYFASRKAK